MSNPKKKYFVVEYGSEIVEANNRDEAVAIAKQHIHDRDIVVDEENTYEIEDKDILKEIEEHEKMQKNNEAKTNR